MDDAAFVRGLERLRDLSRDRKRLGERERTPRDTLGQCLALDELEHQGGTAIHVLDAVDRADVWVIERRQGACFSLEARATIGVIRGVRGQKLDGDLTTQPLVAGAIDFPIPPEPIGARTV